MQEQSNGVESCPSFNSYSSDQLATVASRVREEETSRSSVDGRNVLADDDFEFVFVRTNPDGTALIDGGGDEVRGPVFPLFNRDLLLDRNGDEQQEEEAGESNRRDFDGDEQTIRLPLKNLFIEDRDPPSSSSSEADELERIPPGTYCVWTPKTSAPPSPRRCKKSNSTGSSSKTRWRLRDLLRRSSSDGKESFVFLTPNNNSSSGSDGNLGKKKEEEKAKPVAAKGKGKAEKVSAHEVFYVRNKALKEGDKRKSYLPYRQDLLGFFASANSFGKGFPPF